MIKKIICLFTVLTFLVSNSVCAADKYYGYTIPVDIEINGSFIKCVEKPILNNATTYIPLRAFSDAIGGNIEWNESELSATLKKDEHCFVFFFGKDYCIVNGIKKNFKSIIYKNLMFVPVRAISETIGYSVKWDDFYLTVKITAPGIEIHEKHKDSSYTYKDIKYLAKITQLESGNEKFDVKLGVAGTVVNRMKSSDFPDTIKEVVLDTKYGVQFPPAHTDKINITPSSESVIAAKCALNGVNVVGSSLYFIDVGNAHGSWVHKNRQIYKTIGSMSFYK